MKSNALYASGPSNSDRIQQYLVKPGLSALIGTAISKATVLRGDSYIDIRGTKVPVVAACAAAMYGAALFGELSHEYILPMVSKSERFESLSGVVQPALVGTGNLIAIN